MKRWMHWDVWTFNEEIVARAIWNCKTPVISAVGHETDTTIADYVADLRAPTPSAGAELAVADMASVLLQLQEKELRQTQLMRRALERAKQLAGQYHLMLRLNGPEGRLQQSEQFLLNASERMDRAIDLRLKEAAALSDRFGELLDRRIEDCLGRFRYRLELSEGKLKALSPSAKLEAGYAYIEDENSAAVRSVSGIKAGDELRIRLKDGRIRVLVREVEADETPR